MIIKRAIRFFSYALAFLGLGSVQSCKDEPTGELCYRCTWTYTYDAYSDTESYQDTFCFEDAKSYFPGLTRAEFIEYINEFEDENDDGECKKKSLR